MLQVVLVGFTTDEADRWIEPHMGPGLVLQDHTGHERPVLVAVGQHVADPVREAAEWGFARPDAHVVLAAPGTRTDALRTQLLTTPFLPQDLEVVATDDPMWFRDAIRRVQAAVATQGRIEQANAFLRRAAELV